ncbi:YmaF family protein [Pelosinus sp. IPA-1]|uniref:YmaF family protein n=1 Tax=Pelosinus sp. IPA-1 TaxID=3029569 RepID=UPI0024361BD0|nr:YmaF family protein [Pelosinus sp. IPA-1]GMA97814.1 hypothetical protein PIPA1_06140 [Pelosinus sp. IPA-1]
MAEDNRKKHDWDCDCECECECPPTQTHVHEFEGSVKIAEASTDPHNHRFAGVSSEVIPFENSHVHELFTKTDFYEDHHHEVAVRTGLPIDVGNGRHVHFKADITTVADGHVHEFQIATLIQDPIGD